MSTRMTDEQLQYHIDEAIRETEQLLSEWRISINLLDRKRAQLLSYWIKTYTDMLRRESEFNPSSIPRLSRRQIVNVDFGFRIGSELGGLHYAVVLDKNNRMSSNTVTVLPLGSQKDGHKDTLYRISLLDGIYSVVERKVNVHLGEAQRLILSLTNDRELQAMPETERIQEVAQRYTAAKKKLDMAQASLSKMKKLKYGSIANISQITTISKMRIKEPVTPHDVLFGVKVTPADMERIDDAIKELYIPKGKISQVQDS